MKKVLFLICSLFFFITVASANVIRKIDMEIFLNEDGSGSVTEMWNTNNNSGTENYHQFLRLGDSVISNFEVRNQTKKFEYIDHWDINESFKNKAYKNGINYIDDGVEICWGITEYGDSTYYMTYDISNIIKNTNDGYQVLYWEIFPESKTPIQDYSIIIKTNYYIPDNTDVWGFGAKGTYTYVENGVIKLSTDRALKSNERVVILAKFPAKTFASNSNIDKSFDQLLKEAKKGSSAYKESIIKKIFSIILNFLPYIITLVIVCFAGIKGGSNKAFKKLIFNDNKKLPKDVPNFRDIPCNKDIYAASYISHVYDITKDDKNFIGCIVLKWLKDDIITVGNAKDSSKGTINLKDPTLPSKYTDNTNEIQLYSWMYEASDKGVLTVKQFKKYCEHHYNAIMNWSPACYESGKESCIKLSYLTASETKNGYYNVTDRFYDEGKRILGLKNFLIEFSDMKNKEPIEVKLWDEYLMFAQLFGIAKKVAKQFNDLYPEITQTTNFDYDVLLFVHSFSYSGYSAASSAYQAARNYSAGGGGFSAGGGGGTSFGGGGSMGSR